MFENWLDTVHAVSILSGLLATMVVGAVWVAQLIWSPLWLSVFSMGPLEWLWRCLTYGRMVAIRKPAPASVAL